MTENLERYTAQPGYAMVELPVGRGTDAPATPDKRLDDLRRRLDSVGEELEQAHGKLAEIEGAARAAVDAEDAQRTAATWQEKRRLRDRIAELQQRHTALRRELHADVLAALAELRQGRADIDNRRAEQEAHWRQLIASSDALLHDLREADTRRQELSKRETAWRTRWESLASRSLEVLTGGAAELAALPRHTPAAAGRSSAPQAAARQWSVYDPDSGTIVRTLPELLRLLARWYPGLRTEQERVQEFLTMPNAGPMPERLRRELEAAGYLSRTDSPADYAAGLKLPDEQDAGG